MTEHQTVQEAVQRDTDASATESPAGEAMTSVAEARRYRKRAQAAEQTAADLRLELQQKTDQLAEREKTITSLERRQRIDELLLDSRTIDLDSARLLTEMAVAEMVEPDLESAVAELRARKPFLFQVARSSSGALAPRSGFEGTTSSASNVERAAAEAHATGHRADLLRYLRLRRKR